MKQLTHGRILTGQHIFEGTQQLVSNEPPLNWQQLSNRRRDHFDKLAQTLNNDLLLCAGCGMQQSHPAHLELHGEKQLCFLCTSNARRAAEVAAAGGIEYLLCYAQYDDSICIALSIEELYRKIFDFVRPGACFDVSLWHDDGDGNKELGFGEYRLCFDGSIKVDHEAKAGRGVGEALQAFPLPHPVFWIFAQLLLLTSGAIEIPLNDITEVEISQDNVGGWHVVAGGWETVIYDTPGGALEVWDAVPVGEIAALQPAAMYIDASQTTNSQVPPDFLIELEKKYVTLARKEVEAREKAGFAVTPEWLEALERKHQALALQEIATLECEKVEQ